MDQPRREAFRHFRKPTALEISVLADLSAHLDDGLTRLKTLLVASMDDGGMGSLRLAPRGKDSGDRRFGGIAADGTYFDSDGVEVLAALYVDSDGQPLELDMWKVDFSSLVGPLTRRAGSGVAGDARGHVDPR